MKITKEQYDALTDTQKAMFKKSGDGFEMIDAKSDDGADELKKAKERMKEERNAAKKEAADLKAKLAELEKKAEDDDDAAARKKGDIDALTDSYEKKLSKQADEFNAKLDARGAKLNDLLVETNVTKLASEIAGENAHFLEPLIRQRLKLGEDGETLQILGTDGKLSASSLGDLKKEIVDDPRNKALVIAGKGSGGGAPAPQQKGGGAPEKVDYAKSETKDIVAAIDAKRRADGLETEVS